MMSWKMHIVLRCLTVLCVERVIALLQSDTWSRLQPLDGYISSPGTVVTTRNAVHCGIKCQNMLGCRSFFFISSNMTSNCQLHIGIFSSISDMVLATDTKYYMSSKSDEATYQCHANDGQYRAFQLKDSTVFNYKISQILAPYIDAESECISENGTLVHITTAKLEMISALLSCPSFASDTDMYYLNGMYDRVNGEWKYTDGYQTTFPDQFWGDGEPFNPTTFDCFVLSSPSYTYAVTERCSFEYGFICEK